MMEAGWSARQVARQLFHSDCVARRCWNQGIREMSSTRTPDSGSRRQTSRREDRHILKDIWDRGAPYVCCSCSPPINASTLSGAAHEETGLQWNETRSTLATNIDSISLVMPIVFVCGDPVVNASILHLLYSDIPLPQSV
ncbi:uncharacterized protein TNCV_1612531 [Trichonephila clavipes]|nr:uncharacterized protein TNCV_1612531 [Trichonephila clavipes]